MRCYKVAHRRESHAWAAIKAMVEKKMAMQGDLTPYLCPRCGMWHVGHRRWASRITPATWEAIGKETNKVD